MERPLERYFVPLRLRTQIYQGPDHYSDSLNEVLAEGNNNMLNPARRLSTLLFVEEMQMEFDILRYNMEDVTMTKEGPYMVLQVRFYNFFFKNNPNL